MIKVVKEAIMRTIYFRENISTILDMMSEFGYRYGELFGKPDFLYKKCIEGAQPLHQICCHYSMKKQELKPRKKGPVSGRNIYMRIL